MKFQEKLAKLIKERGITQTQLASDTNIYASMISTYLSGKCLPSARALVAFEQYFGLTGAELIGDTYDGESNHITQTRNRQQ